MFGGKRWCFTTCALFMLCPRSSYIFAFLSNELFQYKLPLPKLLNARGKSPSPRWSLNIVQETGPNSKLEEHEPGFDFDDEEIKKLKIWPGGAIPYYIDEFSFDKVLRDRIRNFLDVTNGMTGLNFLELHRPPGDDETRWVFFLNRQGILNCVDHPFKNFTSKGVQKILLGYDCLSKGGELAQVVLGLVGIPPQHNAPNRNKYIEIVKSNIMPGKENLFEILQNKEWLFHDIDYDFTSASHYNLHKYTVNGKATIKPLDTAQSITIGETKGFSYTDIRKIRMMYNYISKKRLKSLSKPECKKLFNIGTNFSNYVHDSEDSVQPRNKPNKYLGLPESESDKNNETNTNIQEKEVTKEESAEKNNPDEEQDIGNEGQKSVESNKNVSQHEDKIGSSDEKVNENITAQNSNAESNVQTNDDVSKPSQMLKFVRPVKNKLLK